ncbi:UNVERIFIED_CONTAM: hypothetical protein GTU68_009814 [Idotea baltica]|nr:hypothetical protein [Idotea baltica]
MRFSLPELPFDEAALEPHISRHTVQLHYGKHHAGYVKKLNDAIKGTQFESSGSLEDIIGSASGELYNLAAQTWNHTFLWLGINPAASEPGPKTAHLLENSFGSIAAFKKEFATAAQNEFGSGWAWLVSKSDGTLEIDSTTDAVNPISQGKTPILTLDVWEHAYYLDYQNARANYIDAYLEHLINWDFVERNLDALSEQ